MTIHSTVTQVGTSSPGLVYPPDIDGVRLHVRANKAIYLGNGNITSETGYLLPENADLDLFLGPSEKLYALSTDGRANVYVLATMNQ